MEFASAPKTFTGHFDVYPPNDTLMWNIFVPEERDFKMELLGAAMVLRDEHYPRGANTLDYLTPERRMEYAQMFASLELRFAYECEQGQFELVPNGKGIPVNEENYLDYLKRLEALYSAFHGRQIAFAVLEDDRKALLPLVPPQVPSANVGGGRFDRVHNGASPIPLSWVPPGEVDYCSVLPLNLLESSPPERAATAAEHYTPCFLFCKMGECVVERCVGWAPLANALEFQRRLSQQGTPESVNAHALSTSSSHFHNVCQLREGSQRLPAVAGSATSRTDTGLTREEEERLKSEYMRRNAVPVPCTAAERALFSPTHESGGIFAPIQALTL